jgi:hypothetical protein
MFFILLVSSLSVVSQFSSTFNRKVEKITIRWIAQSGLRTTGPTPLVFSYLWYPIAMCDFQMFFYFR